MDDIRAFQNEIRYAAGLVEAMKPHIEKFTTPETFGAFIGCLEDVWCYQNGIDTDVLEDAVNMVRRLVVQEIGDYGLE